jgi:hypothetical protein
MRIKSFIRKNTVLLPIRRPIDDSQGPLRGRGDERQCPRVASQRATDVKRPCEQTAMS